MSLSRFIRGSQPEHNPTINLDADEGGRGQGPVTQAHLSAAVASSMVEGWSKMNQTMEAYWKGHSDIAKTLDKVALILEETKKGTKRSSKEEAQTRSP